jgi:hypothetical protein
LLEVIYEVIYGEWTFVRDMIQSVFCKCKDVQFLTLLNLLDNYVPLVLSIYSIVFSRPCSIAGLLANVIGLALGKTANNAVFALATRFEEDESDKKVIQPMTMPTTNNIRR